METKTKITLEDVLCQFNPYHDSKDPSDLQGALRVNSEKREVFNDLLINVMDPEHEDVRQWDSERWQGLMSFAQDFNNFLRSLDSYYKQERNNRTRTPKPKETQ